MKRYLMATTAAIALVAAPMAVAQDSNSTMENTGVFQSERYEDMAPVDGFFSADPNQILATRFIGAYIYSNAGEEAETIGDVNDIIMTPDGRAVAVIAGIGGFLGIGEKEVAVSIDQLSWQSGEDGEQYLVGSFTKEQLEGAPEFDRDGLRRNETAATETEQSGEMEKQADAENMNAEPTEEVATEQTGEKPEETAAVTATDEQTDTVNTGAINRMETVSAAEANLEASEIIGMSVTSADGETVGEVSEILIGENGSVEAFIVDVGGFLGMNEKPVAISFENLEFARAEGASDWSAIQTGLTTETLEGHTAFTKDQYETNKDEIILDGSMN